MAHGFRHGSGGESRKPPVLNEAYPQDVTVTAAYDSVTFEVLISEAGKPAEYTYQWYYDGSAVNGANEAAYTRPAQFGAHTVYCAVSNEAGTVISRTATVTANKLYLYNKGNEYTELTGGWTISSTGSRGSDRITVGRTSTVTTASGYTSVSTTRNALDFTPFKTVTVHIVAYGGSNGVNGRGRIYVYNSSGNAVSTLTLFNSTTSGTNVTKTIDVSSLKGNHTVRVEAYLTGDMKQYAYVTFDSVDLT